MRQTLPLKFLWLKQHLASTGKQFSAKAPLCNVLLQKRCYCCTAHCMDNVDEMHGVLATLYSFGEG